MKLLADRRAAALAERHLQGERELWHAQTMTMRARIARHRAAITVGTGALTGLLFGFLPVRGIAKGGRLVASAAGFVLRTPIGSMLLDGMRHRPPTQAAAPPTPAS